MSLHGIQKGEDNFIATPGGGLAEFFRMFARQDGPDAGEEHMLRDTYTRDLHFFKEVMDDVNRISGMVYR